MRDLAEWRLQQARNQWRMPTAPAWKRLPIIRHIRAKWLEGKVRQHNAMWSALGSIPTGYDSWIIFGIWHRQEAAD